MPKYLSGRVKRTPQGSLTTDRYRYLGLDQTEPNLGDPANPLPNIPSGTKFQIVGLREYPGERYWSPIQGGIQPGSITVREEGVVTPPNGISSVTDVNFKGAAVTVEGFTQPNGNPGTAVTVTVAAPGTDHGVLFNNDGEFATSPFFTFDNSIGIGSVGIGTSTPSQNLHVVGNLRLEKTIYGEDNLPGDTGNLLVKTVTGGVKWVSQSSVEAGAGGTFGQIQYHGPAGLIDGASNFVFDYTNNRVGIGTTQPELLLDVKGNSKFTGFTTFTNDVRFNSNVSIAGTLTYEDVTNVDAIGLITARAGIRVLTNGVDVDSGGINVDAGGLNVTGLSTFNDGIFFPDQKRALFGNTATNADFEIRHNSDAGYNEIQSNNGNIRIRNYDTSAPGRYLYLQSEIVQVRSHTNNHSMISAFANAQVDLYHNNLLKLRTTGVGVTVFGELDTTNIRSVGIVTTNDLNVSGVVTSNLIPSLTNNFDLGSSNLSWRNLYVTNLVEADRIEVQSLKVTGLSTFVGVVTTSSDLYVGGNLYGDDATNISGINSVTATEYYGTGGTGSKLFVPDEDENLIAGNNAGIGITAEGTGTNFSACHNLLLGCNTGRCITIGDHNIAMGHNTGNCLTTAGNNVLIGREVGMGLSTGGGASENVMIGRNTGKIPYGENNVFLGFNAGQCISKANNSVFIGQEAGRGPAVDATTAGCTSSSNVFIGYRAGRCYRSGSNNVVLGSNAATNVCGGSYNFFALNCSARYHCSGSNNIAIGQYAMFCGGNHAGDGQASNNILLGAHAGCFISSADNNTFIGQSTGRRICTGCNNIALGTNALTYATTSSQNISIGNNSLLCNISGTNNIALGQQAARCQVSGCGNVTLGNRVGFAATDGDNNILMGCCTARLMTCGNRNIILGCCAGANLTTANDNILIGCRVAAPIADGSTQFAIGYGTDYWITGNSSRDIGIGHTLPEAKLDVLDNTNNASHSSFIVRSNNSVTRDKKFEVFANGDTFIKGQVGIGTDNPSQKLHIEHDSFHQILLKRVGDFPSEAIFSNSGSYTNISNNSSGIQFLTGATPESVMVVRAGGNVGIGTDNPADLVHINTTNNVGGIRFGNAQNLNAGTIRSNWNSIDLIANQNLIFQTGGFVEKMRLNSDGDLLRGGTGQDIGSSGSPWDKVYANEFIGQINTTQENVTTGNLKVNGIGTFVGNVEIQGDVSIGGTLTYEDVANIDAVGMVTARSGVNITGGGLNVVGVSTFSSDLIIPEFIYHAGDLNTKFGFSGTDTFAIDTAGAERLEINSNGTGRFKGGAFLLTNGRLNVNYNIAHSSTYYLDNDAQILVSNGDSAGTKKSVLKLGGEAALVYGGSGSGSLIFSQRETETVRIDSNGRVGIGTDDPNAKLHIGPLQGNTTPHLYLASGNNNWGFRLDVQDFSAGDVPLRIFARNSGSDTERVRITNDGKVGIGSTIPQTKLDVNGGLTVNALNIDTSGAGEGDLLTSGGPDGVFGIYNTTNSGKTVFPIKDSAGNYNNILELVNDRAIIDGNVGIGTTNPDTNLHVMGQIKVDAGNYGRVEYARNDTNLWSVGLRTTDDLFFFRESGSGNVVFQHGNVGIGTTNAKTKFNVYTYPHSDTGGILVQNANYTSNLDKPYLIAGTQNWTGATSDWNTYGFQHKLKTNSSGEPRLTIDVAAGGGNIKEIISFRPNGKVGIGTDNPGALLDIGGNTDGNIQAIMTRGFDTSFQLQFRNETSSNSPNSVAGMFGLFRNATDIVGMQFLRGTGVGPGSLKVTTGGTEKLRIISGGSVNIGGDYTQTTDKFQVTGNAKINGNLSVTGVLSYDDVTNIDSIGIITARDGINVSGGGINVTGVSTFNDDLNISSSNPRILLTDTDNDSDYEIRNNNGVFEIKDTTNNSGRFKILSNGITTIEAPLNVNGNFITSGTASVTGGNLQISGTAPFIGLNDSDNNPDYRLYNINGEFQIYDSTNAAVKFNIKNNKVGIGTNNPFEVLHVVQSGTTAAEFRLENNEGYLLVRADNNLATYGAEQHLFHNRANSTEYLRITSAGRVGIGSISPSSKLDVQGDINFNNYALISSNVDSNNIDHIWHSDVTNYGKGGTWNFVSDGTYKSTGNSTLQMGFVNCSGGGNFIGTVAIGHTTPSTLLDVHTTTEGEVARFRASNNTRYLKISSFNAEFHGSGYRFDATSAGGALSFAVTGNEKLRITKNGDLLRGGTGQDIGSATATWDKIYANEFIGQINTVQQNITVNNLFVSGISTFVGVATFSSVGIGSAPTDFLTSDFVVGDGQSSSGMTIYSDGTLGQILFADGNTSNDRQRGKIVYNHSNDSMQFATNVGTKVTIESGGNVGIGTDNPDADLHISSSNPDIKLQDADGSLQFSQIVQQGANLKVRLRDGSNDGGLSIQGYGGASVTNFVNINGSNGRVGIGTDTIQQKLTVQDSIQLRSASANTILFFQRTDTLANGWIGIPEWNDDALYIYGPTSNSNEIAAGYSQGDWIFYSGGDQSLKIRDGGSVNIGGDYNQTTDKLQVTGNAKINGNLTVTGALTYDDVTNIDSIGIITARNGIHVTGGRVGIGTTTPTYDLEVSDGRAWFKPNETGAEAVALSLGRYDTATGLNQSFYDISVNDATGDDVTHFIKRYQANYFFNRTSPYGEQRAVRFYSVIGSGSYVGIYNTMGSDMNVKLHGNAISYINNDSHFGIGTSNPSTRLHLKGDGTSTSGLMFENSFDKFKEYFDGNTDNSDFVLTYEGTGQADLRFKADGDVVLNESGNGNVGIRNANPSYDLHVTGTVAATNFDSLSDRKHKTNIQVIENPIEKIMKIDGVSFDWKETNQPSLGVIADNVQEVLPEIVSGEDTKSVNYNGLIGLLIEVVKDQQKQIDELRGLLDK